jgi:hypothetical protein
MVGDEQKGDRSMTYNGEFTGLIRFPWLLRLAAYLCGGTVRLWRARGRRVAG